MPGLSHPLPAPRLRSEVPATPSRSSSGVSFPASSVRRLYELCQCALKPRKIELSFVAGQFMAVRVVDDGDGNRPVEPQLIGELRRTADIVDIAEADVT